MIIVLLFAALMCLVGAGLLASGIDIHREDGPGDGTTRMAVGGPILAVGLVIGLVAGFTGDGGGVPPEDSVAADTPDDVYTAIQGADKYLSSIEQMQLTFDGAVGAKMSFSFTGDDASGQIQTDAGKVDLLRVDGETYMHPEDKFYGASGQAAIALVDERWLHVNPDNQMLGVLVPFADRERLRSVLNTRHRFIRTDTRPIGAVDCSGFRSKLTNATVYIEEGMSQYKLLQVVYRDRSVGTLAYGDSGAAPVKPTRVVDIDEIFPDGAV